MTLSEICVWGEEGLFIRWVGQGGRSKGEGWTPPYWEGGGGVGGGGDNDVHWTWRSSWVVLYIYGKVVVIILFGLLGL